MTLAILIAASALLANALQQPKTARDVEVQPPTGTASISGVVVTAGDRPQPGPQYR